MKPIHKSSAAIFESFVPSSLAVPVDKLESIKPDQYTEIVQSCRFFYRNDPIASTVINKLIEIGITDIKIDTMNLSNNDIKIYSAYLDKIHNFIEHCALEYLVTGLVVPEILFEAIDKDNIKQFGIKKYTKIFLPSSMWVRNSEHIKINSSLFADDKPSYFLKIPMSLIDFVNSGGQYSDGTKDIEKYKWLIENFPEFVQEIKKGKTEILLNNDLIVRSTYMPDSPYPIPYLYPALSSLKHKRNLRRMDYALASRAIAAIQHIKVGSDEFPLLEGEEEIFEDLKAQFRYRNTSNSNQFLDSILQIYTNHTVNISWIIPNLDALLSNEKYKEINDDIFFALGFPRILTTGETQRSQTSSHELATKSPIKTMEAMQKDLLPIVKYIFNKIGELNHLTVVPKVKFESIEFYRFVDFIDGLFKLKELGGVSLNTLDKFFGLNYSEEVEKLNDEISNEEKSNKDNKMQV